MILLFAIAMVLLVLALQRKTAPERLGRTTAPTSAWWTRTRCSAWS